MARYNKILYKYQNVVFSLLKTSIYLSDRNGDIYVLLVRELPAKTACRAVTEVKPGTEIVHCRSAVQKIVHIATQT